MAKTNQKAASYIHGCLKPKDDIYVYAYIHNVFETLMVIQYKMEHKPSHKNMHFFCFQLIFLIYKGMPEYASLPMLSSLQHTYHLSSFFAVIHKRWSGTKSPDKALHSFPVNETSQNPPNSRRNPQNSAKLTVFDLTSPTRTSLRWNELIICPKSKW